MTHTPLTINKFATGLVQSQPNQILKDDAFPILQNALAFRNTIRRRASMDVIGRLRRTFTDQAAGNSGASPWSFNIYAQVVPAITPEATAQIEVGSITITIGAFEYSDVNEDGILLQITGTGYVTTITNITNDTEAVVSLADPDYIIGDQVYISGVVGMTEINNQYYTITAVNAGVSITIDVDTTDFDAYSTAGTCLRVAGTVNYVTGDVELTHLAGSPVATTITFAYFPGLPVMGIFDRNTPSNTIDNVIFDTTYAYKFLNGEFFEFLPGFTWNLLDHTFPSPVNYWQDDSNLPIFWTTNNRGTGGTPIRYTNGSNAWYDFSPTIDGTNFMFQAKFLVPFRGRLLAFNTWEGTTLGSSINRRNLIRSSAIGTPFTVISAIVGASNINANAWNDTIPGQGYFELLPTTEEIIGVYPTMNQIIIKTNTKTWLLSNLGLNSAPFKVDLLDESLGSNSGFGMVNMGGFVSGIGNRSVTNTSPTTVQSIDEKILDFVFNIKREDQGLSRVYGIRNYRERTNSYIYPYQPEDTTNVVYPNRRLIQNYDNNSWAIYEDSLTALGYFRNKEALKWEDANFSWAEADFQWAQNSTNEAPAAAGNQHGFIGIIDSTIEEGESLFLQDITFQDEDAAIFTSPASNLATGMVVKLNTIAGDFSYLNGTIGQVQAIDEDTFYLFSFDDSTGRFSMPVIVEDFTYIGGGTIQIRRNFSIVTKAFNFLEQGQSMHISYLDALVNTMPNTSVQLSVYASLNNSNAVNLIPENNLGESTFGNKISLQNPTTYDLNEVNNRALINQRGNMLTFELSLSDATMASENFSTPFVLSSMTIWQKPAGRPLMPLGGG